MQRVGHRRRGLLELDGSMLVRSQRTWSSCICYRYTRLYAIVAADLPRFPALWNRVARGSVACIDLPALYTQLRMSYKAPRVKNSTVSAAFHYAASRTHIVINSCQWGLRPFSRRLSAYLSELEPRRLQDDEREFQRLYHAPPRVVSTQWSPTFAALPSSPQEQRPHASLIGVVCMRAFLRIEIPKSFVHMFQIT